MSLSDAERDALEQLQEAVETGDLSLLRKLLNQTDLTNYPFAGSEDRTLLHVACSLGERECVVELLKAGADPNAVDDNGWVSSCEPKRRWQCGQKTRKLSKCSEQSRADRGSRDHLAGQGAILGSFAS